MEGVGALVAVFFLVGIVLAVVGGNIWKNKGGSFAAGFFIVLFLGLIGLVIVAVVNPSGSQAIAPTTGPRATRECPHCKEPMRRDASVCPHCQRDSDPWTYRDGYWWVKRGGEDLYLDERRGEWVKYEPAP